MLMKTSLMFPSLHSGRAIGARSAMHGLFGVVALAAALLPSLHADTLTWDSGGTSPANPLDGVGTWNTSSLWWSNGVSDAAWTNSTGNLAVFGNNNGAAGTVTLGEVITAGGLTFNAPGSGTYTIAGNTLTLGGSATITANASATINSVIAGSAGLTKAGAGVLTLGGTNTYTGGTVISGGVLSADTNANLGASSLAADRSLTLLNGATFRWTGNNSGFNRNWVLGTGTVTIEAVNDGSGAGLGSSGTITFSGSGARTLVLGGDNALTLSGSFGDGSGGATSVLKTGGGVTTLGGTLTYTGTTTVNQGTLSIASAAVMTASSSVRVNQGAIFGINSSQTISELLDGASGGGTVRNYQATGTMTLTVGSGSFSGKLTDGNATRILALSKNTGGTLILTAADSTYSGGTTVSGGTLLINNTSGNALGTGAVAVNTGALGGTGFTAVNVTIGNAIGTQDAMISPGSGGAGTFTTTGSLSLLSDAVFAFELNGATGAVAADKIVANGVSIDAGATFSFTLLGGVSGLQVNDQFKIIDNTGAGNISGQFGNLIAGGTYNAGGGLTFTVSGSGGVYGNDLVLTVATVPEPSTWGLLAAGLTMLLAVRRRRRIS